MEPTGGKAAIIEALSRAWFLRYNHVALDISVYHIVPISGRYALRGKEITIARAICGIELPVTTVQNRIVPEILFVVVPLCATTLEHSKKVTGPATVRPTEGGSTGFIARKISRRAKGGDERGLERDTEVSPVPGHEESQTRGLQGMKWLVLGNPSPARLVPEKRI